MRAWAALLTIPFLASVAEADSLAAAAQRERERREKGGKAPVKVIGDEDLAAGPGATSKGTYNASPGSPSSSGSASAPSSRTGARGPSGAARGGSTEAAGVEAPGAPLSEVDSKRVAARQRLDAAYSRISSIADQLIAAAEQYRRCQGLPVDSTATVNNCGPQLEDIGMIAIAVGVGMADAEEAARQGWLSPGEVRAARQKYGMEDAEWDQLVSLVAQYRR